ncbi:MAG TPA: hypothetical protein VHZ53_17645 [Steroidobacteraceae bacterium]|nr:hypothetical protein [Steroidobacteraceae bacterium]
MSAARALPPQEGPSWFQRLILPGLAFKAVVIGGGYATGRELAEFFLPSGPRGGLAGMVLAMIIWSVVCAVTFRLARVWHSLDYRTFFDRLLGPFAILFELSYYPYIVLILSVFGAAAGALGSAMFGWPAIAGTLCLVGGIALFTTFGNASVERLFKWVSILLYATYGIFLVLALFRFGALIPARFAAPVPTDGWAMGGVTYAAYNVVGAVVILPVMRHIRTDREAVAAGFLAGPLAMLPAIIFFVCMCAFYPEIRNQTLPSDFMLRQMQLPWFHWTFQLMIFAALLECGTGSVHAVNERIASSRRRRGAADLSKLARLAIAGGMLVGSVFLADRFGLVTLIARGYRTLGYVMLVLYVVPVMTFGIWQLRRESRKIRIH